MDQEAKTKSQLYKYKETFIRLFQQKQLTKEKEPINYFQNTFQRQRELYSNQKGISLQGKDYQHYLASKRRKENVKKLRKDIESLNLLHSFFQKESNLAQDQINFKELCRGSQRDNQLEEKLRRQYEAVTYPHTLVTPRYSP